MATTIVAAFATGHADMVHDAQLDFYGRRLATCSSDRSVKIFDVAGDEHVQTGEVVAHEGPVWQVAWAHPQFGVLLASCGYDRRVVVQREVAPGSWMKVLSHEAHGSSVNGISWAPHEYGLQLACASSDGTVSILTHKDDNSWHVARLADCTTGCNAVSWAPAAHIGGVEQGRYVKRIAVAGSDGHVRLYRGQQYADGEVWQREAGPADDGSGSSSSAAFPTPPTAPAPSPHKEWLRDVAWSPASGVGVNTLVSCSDDGVLAIWSQAAAGGPWGLQVLPTFESAVWRVSWSVTGHLLAVSCADNSVTLWKLDVASSSWQQISAVPDPSTGS